MPHWWRTPLLSSANLVAFARSVLFMAVFYGGCVPIVLGAAAVAAVSERGLAIMSRLFSRWHNGCARWILGIRVRIEGEWPSGPVLVAMKHEGMFEALELPRLFDRPLIFAKDDLRRVPVWGRLGERYGLVMIDRDGGAKTLRAMKALAAQAVAEDRTLVLLPEGSRVPHGETPPLKSGFAGLYTLLRLPVVPVAVDTGRLLPKGRFVKRPGVVTYKVGKTIPPGQPRAEAERRVWAAINALNGVEGSD